MSNPKYDRWIKLFMIIFFIFIFHDVFMYSPTERGLLSYSVLNKHPDAIIITAVSVHSSSSSSSSSNQSTLGGGGGIERTNGLEILSDYYIDWNYFLYTAVKSMIIILFILACILAVMLIKLAMIKYKSMDRQELDYDSYYDSRNLKEKEQQQQQRHYHSSEKMRCTSPPHRRQSTKTWLHLPTFSQYYTSYDDKEGKVPV